MGSFVCGSLTGLFVYIHDKQLYPFLSTGVSVCLSDHDICLNFLRILCSDHSIVVNHTYYASSSVKHQKSNLQPDPEEVIHNVMPINNLKR